MVIFSDVNGFDWDAWNVNKNWEKHRVSHLECEEVFFNEPLIIQKNRTHSDQEIRYFALGRSNNGRLLFIVFTIRKDKIRVISVRDMTRRESIQYEQIEKNT